MTYSGLTGKGKNDFGHGNAQFITFLNVLNNAQIDVNIFQKVDVKESETQNRVLKGDLLFNTSSETPEEVAMCSVMGEEVDNLYLNSFCFGFRLIDDNVDPLFLAYLMRSQYGRRQMSLIAQGATRYNLPKREFMKTEICIPANIEEQRFIASFFTELDNRISVKKQRLDLVRQLKKSCLNNLFVNSKENTPPRLRFMGFEGDWIMVRFSDIATIRRGLTYSPDNICESGIRVLRSSNINEDAFALSSSDVFVDQRCVNIPLAKHNDILITAANGSPRLVGKHCLVECENDKMVPGGFMYLVSSDEPEFLNACMGAKWYKDFLVNGVSGGNGAIGNLSKDELEKCQFYIPKEKSERDCIASFFTKLDKQISLQDIQLKKLEQLKKACLNQMIA